MWSIGDIQMKYPVVLAPMAGVTDLPFRLIVKEFGCALVFGQLVSANAIRYGNKKTDVLLQIAEQERPVGLQLFGSDPAAMAAAARYVADFHPDIIDVNLGCPAPKVVDNGDGCALMRDPVKAAEVVRAVVKAVDIPVTVKIRKGWDDQSVTAVEIAQRVEQVGVCAVTIHGRTRQQFYGGNADWDIIAAVREAVSIPVIGNGDVRTPEDVTAMMRRTGCTAVMVGRAALGNPWLFRRIVQYLEHGVYDADPTDTEKVAMAIRHLRMALEMKGDHAVYEMRKHLAWYLKGVPNANKVKQVIMSIDAADEVFQVLYELLEQLATVEEA
jgi:tRNA-dihydrouridine synthase B